MNLSIELSPAARQIAAAMPVLPKRIVTAIAKAIGEQNQYTVAKIQADHLTGKGPFPPDEHRLGVRTNRLRGSVTASGPDIVGDSIIISAIGSNVKYAAIHEFGGVIHIAARSVTVKLRTDARGNLVRQMGHPRLAMFAGSTHKRFKSVKSESPAHDITMPERSPFRTGIRECLPAYGRRVSAAMLAEWKNLSS